MDKKINKTRINQTAEPARSYNSTDQLQSGPFVRPTAQVCRFVGEKKSAVTCAKHHIPLKEDWVNQRVYCPICDEV